MLIRIADEAREWCLKQAISSSSNSQLSGSSELHTALGRLMVILDLHTHLGVPAEVTPTILPEQLTRAVGRSDIGDSEKTRLDVLKNRKELEIQRSKNLTVLLEAHQLPDAHRASILTQLEEVTYRLAEIDDQLTNSQQPTWDSEILDFDANTSNNLQNSNDES